MVVDFCGRGAVRGEGIGTRGSGWGGKGRGRERDGFSGRGVGFIRKELDPAARRAHRVNPRVWSDTRAKWAELDRSTHRPFLPVCSVTVRQVVAEATAVAAGVRRCVLRLLRVLRFIRKE